MNNQKGIRNPNWKGGKKDCICETCEKPYKSYEKTSRFCSIKCYRKKWSSGTKIIKCKICKKPFKVWASTGTRYYCSTKCEYSDKKHMSEKTKKGGEGYVKSKQNRLWKNYRKRALEHYDLICQICTITLTKEEAVIHHKDGTNYPRGNHTLKNLAVLCRSCHNKLAPKHHKMLGDKKVEQAIAEMMYRLKLNMQDPNLKETPRRIATMYETMFEGLKEKNKPQLTFFPNKKSKYDEIIIVKANFMSMCSHHFMPFYGSAYFGYIPDKKLVGLSKIRRVIDYYAHRPQLQETLTHQVIEFLNKKLKPKGCMLVMSAVHMCIAIKDNSQLESKTATSAIKGCFKEQSAKNEFLRLINEIK